MVDRNALRGPVLREHGGRAAHQRRGEAGAGRRLGLNHILSDGPRRRIRAGVGQPRKRRKGVAENHRSDAGQPRVADIIHIINVHAVGLGAIEFIALAGGRDELIEGGRRRIGGRRGGAVGHGWIAKISRNGPSWSRIAARRDQIGLHPSESDVSSAGRRRRGQGPRIGGDVRRVVRRAAGIDEIAATVTNAGRADVDRVVGVGRDAVGSLVAGDHEEIVAGRGGVSLAARGRPIDPGGGIRQTIVRHGRGSETHVHDVRAGILRDDRLRVLNHRRPVAVGVAGGLNHGARRDPRLPRGDCGDDLTGDFRAVIGDDLGDLTSRLRRNRDDVVGQKRICREGKPIARLLHADVDIVAV